VLDHSLETVWSLIRDFNNCPADERGTVSPTAYEGTMHLVRIVEGNRTLIEWSVAIDAAPQDADRWHALFQSWIPEWTHSLAKALGKGLGPPRPVRADYCMPSASPLAARR